MCVCVCLYIYIWPQVRILEWIAIPRGSSQVKDSPALQADSLLSEPFLMAHIYVCVWGGVYTHIYMCVCIYIYNKIVFYRAKLDIGR